MQTIDGLGGFATTLGLDIEEASGDGVVIRFEAKPHLLQPYGIVHGGVYSSAVETAASIGAALWLADRGQVVGVSNQTDFLRAVRTGELTAVASPIHRGRSQQLWQVEITDAEQRLVARGQVRLQNLQSADGLG
ncbi:PaaI family thioesterase [Micromonospora sp. NPDC049679]|uniref:PaaI family thioesterase n=1 Tax=Micromonospora sp. NPDC049679 TaxID=3155920 RepID=UPI0033ED3D23